MTSFKTVKATMALLLAAMVILAMVTSGAAMPPPVMEPDIGTSSDITNVSAMATPAMTTPQAVWIEADAVTDAIGALANLDDAKAYLGQTKTTTAYPELPTDSNTRCLWGQIYDINSDRAPLTEDCIELARRISGWGNWRVFGFFNLWHQLIEWRTCAFRVRVDPWRAWANIGNQDIIGYILRSVEKYDHGGRVEAGGKSKCQLASKKMNTPIEWQIIPG